MGHWVCELVAASGRFSFGFEILGFIPTIVTTVMMMTIVDDNSNIFFYNNNVSNKNKNKND